MSKWMGMPELVWNAVARDHGHQLITSRNGWGGLSWFATLLEICDVEAIYIVEMDGDA